MPQDIPKSIPSQFEVIKAFPQRNSLSLYRLAKATPFTCHRCTRGKTAKLVAFVKDKWEEPVCNGCYGHTLSVSKNEGGKDGQGGTTSSVSAPSQQRAKDRRNKKARYREGKGK